MHWSSPSLFIIEVRFLLLPDKVYNYFSSEEGASVPQEYRRAKQSFCSVVQKINSASTTVGKDGKVGHLVVKLERRWCIVLRFFFWHHFSKGKAVSCLAPLKVNRMVDRVALSVQAKTSKITVLNIRKLYFYFVY